MYYVKYVLLYFTVLIQAVLFGGNVVYTGTVITMSDIDRAEASDEPVTGRGVMRARVLKITHPTTANTHSPGFQKCQSCLGLQGE